MSVSNLIFLVDKSVAKENSFNFFDEKGTLLTKVGWEKQPTDFYKDFIVSSREYKIYFPSPARYVGIYAYPGIRTFIRIGPYYVGSKIAGVQISVWTGEAGEAVTATVRDLVNAGYRSDTVATKLVVPGQSIFFTPEAPWEIPPPPK